MEIEIKARIENAEEIKSNLVRMGARKIKESHQIDEYYSHPGKDIRHVPEYIRLRHDYGADSGIFAYHINIDEGVNDEKEVGISNINIFKDMLALLGMIKIGVIDKKRAVYAFGGFKVTIDVVRGIDTFVEVETEGQESEVTDKKEECRRMLLKLGIPLSSICHNVWLCDIATGKTEYLRE